MAAGERKTQPSDPGVTSFLDSVGDARRAEDAREVVALMTQVTGADPVMWGASIIGFGRQRYTTADGKEHASFAVGLSPRKQSLTLYGLTFYGSHTDLLERLGPHATGKGCVYVKRLGDVDTEVLRELIAIGWETNHHDDESSRA